MLFRLLAKNIESLDWAFKNWEANTNSQIVIALRIFEIVINNIKANFY